MLGFRRKDTQTILLLLLSAFLSSECFLLTGAPQAITRRHVLHSHTDEADNTIVIKKKDIHSTTSDNNNRRTFLLAGSAIITSFSLTSPKKAVAKEFAPGGTLVDYEVGIQVNNLEASPSRKVDNSNVIFPQDYYYKFGTAAQWIEPGSTEFPKTMPFTLNQQRYDALKKYGMKITSSCIYLETSVKEAINSPPPFESSIPDPTTSMSYSLRAFGLLANNFLASENTGTTNELVLARYYINEIYLHINDIRMSGTSEDAMKFYLQLKKAMNSYLTLMNRVITSKVGDKFQYI